MSDTMKALDEIEAALREHLPDARVALAITRIPTLRAALTPPADDEIEAVRARHEERMHFSTQPPPQIAADFDTLLRALDAERARRVEVEGALKPFAAMVSNHPEMDAPSPVITLTYNKAHLRRAATLTKDTP